MPNDQTPPRSPKERTLLDVLERTEALGQQNGIDLVTIKVAGKDWHKITKITESPALAFSKIVDALREPKYGSTYDEVQAIVEQLEGLLPMYEQLVKDMLDEVIPEDVVDSGRLIGLKVAIYALKTGWPV